MRYHIWPRFSADALTSPARLAGMRHRLPRSCINRQEGHANGHIARRLPAVVQKWYLCRKTWGPPSNICRKTRERRRRERRAANRPRKIASRRSSAPSTSRTTARVYRRAPSTARRAPTTRSCRPPTTRSCRRPRRLRLPRIGRHNACGTVGNTPSQIRIRSTRRRDTRVCRTALAKKRALTPFTTRKASTTTICRPVCDAPTTTTSKTKVPAPGTTNCETLWSERKCWAYCATSRITRYRATSLWNPPPSDTSIER